MSNIKNLGSTAIYAYTTLISVIICVPGIFIFERGVFAAIKEQVALKGATEFYGALLRSGRLLGFWSALGFL